MTETMGPGMTAVMEKIQKLLNLASKNPNAEEAASAAAKAQELLTRYNLDAATVEREGGVEGRREEAKTRGGFYLWQRELWTAVARLNYCLYWTQTFWEKGEFRVRLSENQRYWSDAKSKTTDGRWQRRHRVVGRVVNTRSTIAMATYLEETIERLARDSIRGDTKQLYSRPANSFRYGAMEVVVYRINERYWQMEKDVKAEADKAARRAAAMGTSTSTALTMADLRKSEYDANMDHIHGEGYSAQRREREAEAARQRAEEEAEYVRWAAANPEEARKREAEEEKRTSRYRGRAERTVAVDGGAYRRGREAAKGISIDRQAATTAPAGRLT